MQLKYSLRLRDEGVNFEDSLQDGAVNIDGVIAACISKEGKLNSIDLILEKATMKFTAEGVIKALSKDIGKMVRVGKYLADRILVQTNVDVIDIELSFNGSPEMSPESVEEEEEFIKRRKEVYKLHTSCWKSTSKFEPWPYPNGYKNAGAFAEYADGLRAIHEKSKVVFYYRVLEHFAKNPKSVQPGSFCKHASKYDKSGIYTKDKIKDITDLRVDSAHACSKIKINSSTIEELRKLALLFLENPPENKLG